MSKEEALKTLQKIQSCIEHDACELIDCAYFSLLPEIKMLIDWIIAPKEIVCCKDCVYYRKKSESGNKCLLWKADTYDDFYCANGAKSDGKKWGEE